MALNYTGFSYRPDYGYKLYEGDKLIKETDKVKHAVCFSEVFYLIGGKSKHIYKGFYELRCRKEFKYQSGNYCALDRSQIFVILKYMRRVFDMKATMKETKENYVFNFEIEGKSIKHKFILTFARVFFEYPYNEMAKETFRVRAIGVNKGVYYANKSFLEIFHLICNTFRGYWGAGHSLFIYPCDYINSTKILREAFAEGRDRVQQVFVGSEEKYNKFKQFKLGYNGLDNFDWDIDIEKRIAKYSENFKILKDVKKGVRRRARKVVQ